ncbi:hypothetical protein [Anaerotruncus rubiinfantis]|uniref:hypothetical protein n=1 Tax=Anaerotruncus rubiinfantis TaxID=1720200 RepID=UPI0034A246AB
MDRAIQILLETAEQQIEEQIDANEDARRRKKDWFELQKLLSKGELSISETQEFLTLNFQILDQRARTALLAGIRLGGQLQASNAAFWEEFCEDQLAVRET